jgi:hypothetical protein
MIMSSNRKKVFIVSSILGVAVIAIFSLVPILMNLSSTAEANSLSMVLLISREDGPRVPSPGPVTTILAQSLINLPEMQHWAQMADAKWQTMPPPPVNQIVQIIQCRHRFLKILCIGLS